MVQFDTVCKYKESDIIGVRTQRTAISRTKSERASAHLDKFIQTELRFVGADNLLKRK